LASPIPCWDWLSAPNLVLSYIQRRLLPSLSIVALSTAASHDPSTRSPSSHPSSHPSSIPRSTPPRLSCSSTRALTLIRHTSSVSHTTPPYRNRPAPPRSPTHSIHTNGRGTSAQRGLSKPRSHQRTLTISSVEHPRSLGLVSWRYSTAQYIKARD
jgi:hypothetical protein